MPEANVLYSVTAAVVVGLVAWVAVVLKSAKEPWARETPKPVRTDDVAITEPVKADADEKPTESKGATPSSSLPNVLAGSAGGAAADTTAEATAVVVATKKTDADADADAKPDAKPDAKATDAKVEADADAEKPAKSDDEK